MMVVLVRAYFLSEAAKPLREKRKNVRTVVAEVRGIAERTASLAIAHYSRIGAMLTEETDDMLDMRDPDDTESEWDTKWCLFG
ncbi:hypothetical protein Ae201684P_011203 [Aphanomyces euteiches]|nr:hypothetical protein Ae201684P_011203 [Aphanomyces euteiches]KAH9151742.1 hypothetical protein AeRB84_005712 [Aphanomyces euteiches]